jgi:hypothetical protein
MSHEPSANWQMDNGTWLIGYEVQKVISLKPTKNLTSKERGIWTNKRREKIIPATENIGRQR